MPSSNPPQAPAAGRVAGKTVLLTGAAGGMGAAHARLLCHEGATVVLADLDPAAVQTIAEEINAAEGRRAAHGVALDVTDYAAWEAAVEETVRVFGGLQALVNNAGVPSVGSVDESSLENWHRSLDVNLTGTFYGMKASVEALRRNDTSSIVNVSSIAGLVGFRHRVGYAASKWGVMGLTKTSAMDLGPDGIRVNCINPGSVKTPMTAHLKRGFGQIPLGRPAETDEVSPLVVFLVSDESRFVSGAEIAIDGGETAGNNLRPYQ